jgi:hypothetical protein
MAHHAGSLGFAFHSSLLGDSPSGYPLLARWLLYKKTAKRGGDTMIYLIIPIVFVAMVLASIIRPACRPS